MQFNFESGNRIVTLLTKWGVAHGMTDQPKRLGSLILLLDLILNLHHHPAGLALNLQSCAIGTIPLACDRLFLTFN
jgi:hypothetical protein